MKAAIIRDTKSICCEEFEKPELESDQLLIRVDECGICGSDLGLWRIGMADARIGHEYYGFVENPGPRSDLKKGDRVVSITINPDYTCKYCVAGHDNLCDDNIMSPGTFTPGAMAEFFAARADLVRRLPDNVSGVDGAMVEPAAVALHAVRRATITANDKVMISGAGAIGAFIAEILRDIGVKCIVVTDINLNKAETIKKLGACDFALNPNSADFTDQLQEAAGDDGLFDVIFNCHGFAEVMQQNLKYMQRGGSVILVGMPIEVGAPMGINVTAYNSNELSLYGSYAYTKKDFDDVIALLAEDRIHLAQYAKSKYPIEKVQDAMFHASDSKSADVKVMITLQDKE